MIEQYAAEMPQEFKPGQAYADYIQRHHSERPYPELDSRLSFNSSKVIEKFPPSFIAWNYKDYGSIEKFASQSDSPLPLDPKLATPGAMFAYMKSHSEIWTDMGKLTVPTKECSPDKSEADKIVWKEHVGALFRNGQQKRLLLREQCINEATPANDMICAFQESFRRLAL